MALPGRPALRVHGLDETRRSLRRAGLVEVPKGIRGAHKVVAKLVEAGSRREAGSGTRQQQAAAKALLGKGTTAEAVLAIRNTSSVPFGKGAFLGAIAWQQFPPWVGNSWNLEAGDGPYVIAEAIRDDLDEIEETFIDELRRAFEAAGLEWE